MEAKQIEEECEKVEKILNERLEAHDESGKAAQEKLQEICEGLRVQIKGLEGKVGGDLEEKFAAEDSRLQSAYEDLQMDGSEDISKMIQKAKAELLMMQSYELVDHSLDEDMDEDENEEAFDLSSLCELKTERKVAPEAVELMKPTNVRVSETNKGTISLQFTCLGPDEMRVLSENGDENKIKYKCLLTKKGENRGRKFVLDPGATYEFRVKAVIPGVKESEWGEETNVQVLNGQNPEKLEEELENFKIMLNERIEIHDESKNAAQEKLHEICDELRAQVDELCEKINSELEEKFTAEDNRLQENLSGIRSDEDDISKKIQKAKTELLVEQTYDVVERNSDDENEDEQKLRISSLYELKTERKASFEVLGERKPIDLIPSFTEKGELSLSFTFFNEDEVEILNDLGSPFEAEVKVWEKGYEESTSKTLTKELTLGSDEPIYFRSTFSGSTTYCLKMRILHQETSTQWSDEAEFTTPKAPEFRECCAWKECPDNVDGNRKYSVDMKNPRIATFIGGNWCTIIGNTPLPLDKVTSWNIKVLKSRNNNGGYIHIGVTPSDINQNICNYNNCGWYFNCYYSKLISGPPHNYYGKEYGPRKGNGQYVHTGDSIGVVMDTTKGELSFVVNGVNLGIAYEGIPLDKPLVLCVILKCGGDSIELDTSEVEENVDSSISVPSNIIAKSGITWDSITLTWDEVEGASFYQIEVDGSTSQLFTANAFTKRGFLPETEHTFRVRVVKENTVSEWSDVVKGVTQKESFEASGWKECPDNVDEDRKYSVDEKNPRIATFIGGNWCTIIGNTALPLSKVTSWNIKVLKSKYNDGGDIYIGVAPSDINQNTCNYNKCGWYFYCYSSQLYSGPPHNYRGKEHGPRKGWGKYVHNGDSVGVVMDTAKGELSFVLNGVNHGVAYEGIPLDKPLVPCVILGCKGDSVELVI